MSFSAISHRLLRIRARRGGGYASYFGGDVSAVEMAVADALSAVGNSGRSGILSALEIAPDHFAATGVGAGASGNNDGLIVSNYAAYDPDAAQIVSLDINSTLPNWGTNGGSSISFANEAWWNGASVPVATMRPPTTPESGSGLGALPFWKNAQKAVRQINVRVEYMVSAMYCGDSIQHPKFFIFRAARSLSPFASLSDRPMYFLENMNAPVGTFTEQANSLFLCVSQGTVRMFSSTNLIPGPVGTQWVPNAPGPTTNPLRQPFYHRATAGTDSAGAVFIPATEIVCMEARINVMSTADEPNGVIAYRLYRRNGQVFERGCAWTWDTNYVVNTDYIADIDTFGGGYYNNANISDPNLWTKMGRRITVGFNVQPSVGRAWIGPPTGYVQA